MQWLRFRRREALGSPTQAEVAILASTSASASTVFRALQHVPRLEERLGPIDILLPSDDFSRGHGARGQMLFFARHGVGYVSRFVELRRQLKRYRAILVQRGVYPLGPAAVTQPVRRFSGRVVFDLDDAIFLVHPALHSAGRAARRAYGPQQALALIGRADAIVTSTESLASVLPGRQADAILPTVPDLTGYPQVEHGPGRPVRIGWSGNEGNVRYLDPLRSVFARLASEGLAELEVVSSRPWDGPARFTPWRSSDAPQLFERFHIGIMPLPDLPYTRHKAGFKLLQYMAAGSAVVASPVGVNRTLIKHSGAGLLATTPEEWEVSLRHLALDATARACHGARARRFMEGYVDLEHQADVLARLLIPTSTDPGSGLLHSSASAGDGVMPLPSDF